MTINNAINMPTYTPNAGQLSQQNVFLPAGASTTVATYSGKAGTIKRIYLGITTANPAQCYINITFDGAASPQFGTNRTSGFTAANAIGCDVCFGNASASSAVYWATDVSGSSLYTGTALSGYIAIDMPFKSSFTINVFNNSVVDGHFNCDVLFETTGVNIPYYLYAVPFDTGTVTSAGGVYTECPLLSTSSKNGVILHGVKSVINGDGNDGWQTGKFRAYYGGPGMTSNQTYTAGGASNISYYNQLSGVTQIYASADTASFFLNAADFSFFPLFSSNTSGIVLNTTSNSLGILCMYRYLNLDDNGIGVGPTSGTPPNFVFTWTCCSQNVAVESEIAYHLGMVTYYA